MTERAPRIFHIAQAAAWNGSEADYRGDTLDTEGFIHCSEAHQVMPVANAIFRGVADLVLLEIDPERVGPDIRYESPDGGDERFPHVYGPLNRDAVLATHPLEPDASGEFKVPGVLATRA